MVENMKRVASSDKELTVEERNLLSVAYKNVIGARRASWRIVTSIEQKEESKGNENQVAMIKGYREKIESELAKICEDILEVLDKQGKWWQTKRTDGTIGSTSLFSPPHTSKSFSCSRPL